jgi:hypothetical protein
MLNDPPRRLTKSRSSSTRMMETRSPALTAISSGRSGWISGYRSTMRNWSCVIWE